MISSRLAAPVVAILFATALAVAPSASATTRPTRCSGFDALSGDIYGPVAVPAGGYCRLDHARVHGSVTVGPAARLVAWTSQISGNVIGGSLASVSASDGSVIGGGLLLHGSQAVSISSSQIHRSVVGSLAAGTEEYADESDLLISRTQVGGRVSVRLHGTYRYAALEHARIGGALLLSGATLRISNSDVAGQAVLDDARTDNGLYEGIGTPSWLCAVAISGNLTLHNSPGNVLLGAGIGCNGVQPVRVRASMFIFGNAGDVHITAQVGGNLVCHGNAHTPVAGEATSGTRPVEVGGQLIGQCASLAAA